MVRPDNFTITQCNNFLCNHIPVKNGMEHLDVDIGNDVSADINGVVLFLLPEPGYSIKINNTVKLFPC
ncbi:MAG: hypothetical protein GAK37_01018 [Pseudomonas sp.]|nr:MAG: hypothetical protein GAK37_01018 [Pseudomonas sp.]